MENGMLLDFSKSVATNGIAVNPYLDIEEEVVEQFNIDDIVPVNYHALIEWSTENVRTASGIELPGAFDQNRNYGTIIAIDSEIYTSDKVAESLKEHLRVGSVVQFQPHARMVVPNVTSQNKYLLIPIHTILAILKP
jgi:co-chaperonin GroES (HSP10)